MVRKNVKHNRIGKTSVTSRQDLTAKAVEALRRLQKRPAHELLGSAAASGRALARLAAQIALVRTTARLPAENPGAIDIPPLAWLSRRERLTVPCGGRATNGRSQ